MKKLFSLITLFVLTLPVQASVQDTLLPAAQQYADTASATPVPRSFSPDFKQKYKTPEFNYGRKENNKKVSKFEEFLRWLSDLFSYGRNSDGGLTTAEIIKRIAAGLIILVVVYFIVRALLKKEGYWIFGKARKNITAKDIGVENIETTDFQSLISNTVGDGNYRLGIRYYYLWLLKLMAYNNIIKWHKDKTNGDYAYEIKDEALRSQFRYLSYIYDYSWYGEFTVSKEDYVKAERAFLEIINRLKR